VWLTVVHIEADRDRVDHTRHPSDVIRMGMRRYQEINLLYAQLFQAAEWLSPPRIYECDLSFGRADEDGISLTHVEECDADWLTGLTLGGNAIAGED
jgi:hypothetical protein